MYTEHIINTTTSTPTPDDDNNNNDNKVHNRAVVALVQGRQYS